MGEQALLPTPRPTVVLADSSFVSVERAADAATASAISTRDLQARLSEREGVSSCFVAPGERHVFEIEGPCIVTINRD
jgi:hypothetical protein